MTVTISGNSVCKQLDITGHPSTTMTAGTGYSVGTISNTSLRAKRNVGINAMSTSTGTLIYVETTTSGTISLLPRADITPTGAALALMVTYI